MSVTALITNISRGSLHDGKGIRSVVYLKGCGLRCMWCHNPENFKAVPQILWNATKCIHCGRCLVVCPSHHILKGNQHFFLREGCKACGKCAAACPSQALKLCGEQMTPQQVMEEVRKDKIYFDTSGGGVTFSGGECLLWPRFLAETFRLCEKEGIKVMIETALDVPWQNIEFLTPLVESWYVDVKHSDTEKHKKYTGNGNERIFDNLRRLSQNGARICIRVPLIPGVNDDMENLLATVHLALSLRPAVTGVELLKYNILAGSKYNLLGEKFISFSEEPQSDEFMADICDRLNKLAGVSRFVFFTS